MGLIKEGDKVIILSDILGLEDHLGDMDFKVTGTSKGITALQMDMKIEGITIDTMRTALNQAREGRLHILGRCLRLWPNRERALILSHRGSLPCRSIPIRSRTLSERR